MRIYMILYAARLSIYKIEGYQHTNVRKYYMQGNLMNESILKRWFLGHHKLCKSYLTSFVLFRLCDLSNLLLLNKLFACTSESTISTFIAFRSICGNIFCYNPLAERISFF